MSHEAASQGSSLPVQGKMLFHQEARAQAWSQ
jgi:hypothetical protein